MLDYEWGNPSTMMLTGNDEAAATAATAAAEDTEQTHRQIFDHYNAHPFLPDHLISQAPPAPTPTTTSSDFSLSHHHQQFHSQPHHHHIYHHHQQQHSLFDTRAFSVASSSHFPPPPLPPPPHSMFSLDPLPPLNAGSCGPGGGGFLVVPKSEDVGRSADFSASRIGLNLGGRTYFSSSEDDLVNRFYRPSRPFEPGSSMLYSNNSPRCQAEGCNADLSHAKHYHRRHKVCEFHSKAATVIAAGLTQRFCQQCSRFHLLSEFDNGKRSCRKRLADHNRRRRKTQQPPHQEIQKSHLEKPRNSTLDIAAKGSSPDSGTQSSSSVTVAVSPPDYFQQKPYHQNTTASRTLFFSSG